MPTISLAQTDDRFIIYFGSPEASVNAYTLASTLIHIADAAKAANTAINPGFEIEVMVESLQAGSFRALLRAVYRGAGNIWSNDTVKALVLGVISNFLYQHTLAPNTDVTVNVGPAEVVIEQGDTRIVIPRAVHDSMQLVERSPRFITGIGQAIKAVEADNTIRSFAFLPQMPEPDLRAAQIPREHFALLPKGSAEEELGNTRELEEITEIEILRAILDRSNRRWEFVWNGMKISAPVTDQEFYNQFFAHKITIAPGDALRVKLLVRQKRSRDIGVFINDSFEVIEVLRHLPRTRQDDLPL